MSPAGVVDVGYVADRYNGVGETRSTVTEHQLPGSIQVADWKPGLDWTSRSAKKSPTALGAAVTGAAGATGPK